MDEKVIAIMARAIMFANLTDPNPERGVTRLDAVMPNADARHLAVAALKALTDAGFAVVQSD